MLRGTCAIDDGAFAVRGVQAAVSFEDAKYSGFPGSVVPATDPIPAGSDYLNCDLTGEFHAHPYAFNFTDVQGVCAACSPSTVRATLARVLQLSAAVAIRLPGDVRVLCRGSRYGERL